MAIQIPQALASEFRILLESESFAKNERDYKWTVHLILGAILHPPILTSEGFSRYLSSFIVGNVDLGDLGLPRHSRQHIDHWLGEGQGDLHGAVVNLCGGRWGIPQLDWIPIAVEHGLGSGIQTAFRNLVDDSAPLSERIDQFRDAIPDLQSQLRDAGGFKTGWQVLQPSYPFVGMVLGAYDPTRYTFYHAGNLRAALEALGASWPRMNGGKRYAKVCELVQETHRALLAAGIEVRDLIDTQGLLFVHGENLKTRKTAFPPKGGGENEADSAESLAEAVLWPVEKARKLIKLTERGKPLLFSGPPGTGKTFVARALAQAIALDDDHIEVVQFHPSYAYEDFMEGIRPLIGDQKGTIKYEIRPGVLRRLAEGAREDPDSTYVLIIDEMNRANLPRVLGEVLYCIEYRGKDGEIRLPYCGDTFSLPENVLIIGTMNTADRSIALVDAALRRRFLELEFPPDLDVLKRWWEKQGNAALGQDAAARLERLNAALMTRLDAHRLIGHTYLMDTHIIEEGFEPVWDWQLKPVLQEHLHAHPEDVEQLRKVFLGE